MYIRGDFCPIRFSLFFFGNFGNFGNSRFFLFRELVSHTVHNYGYRKAYDEDDCCDDALGIKCKFPWVNGRERTDYQSEYCAVCACFALLEKNAYDLGGNEKSDDCAYAVIDYCDKIKLAYGSDSVVIAALSLRRRQIQSL